MLLLVLVMEKNKKMEREVIALNMTHRPTSLFYWTCAVLTVQVYINSIIDRLEEIKINCVLYFIKNQRNIKEKLLTILVLVGDSHLITPPPPLIN